MRSLVHNSKPGQIVDSHKKKQMKGLPVHVNSQSETNITAFKLFVRSWGYFNVLDSTIIINNSFKANFLSFISGTVLNIEHPCVFIKWFLKISRSKQIIHKRWLHKHPTYSSSKNCPNVWPFFNVWVITQW